MRRALIIVVTALVFGACSDAAPCNSCPPIDGTYSVSWADGGVTAACPGPRVASWVFAENGAQVTTTIGNTNFGGTLYDSYDLLMTGSDIGVSYRLKALVIPEGTSTDAGVRLEGTFTTHTVPASGDPCDSNETFTAQRVSR